MLGFLFGFNARLGPIPYLAGMVVLSALWTAIYVVTGGRGFSSGSLSEMTWPAIGITVVFTYMILMLQSMRIRDIGWNPVYVIPAWMVIPIIDKLVADNIPAWAVGQGVNGTSVGSAINVGLVLALIFWRSEDKEGPAFREIPRVPDIQQQRTDTRSTPAERIARATGTRSSADAGFEFAAHTFSNGKSMLLRFSSHAGTGRFFERMNSGLNSFD